MTKLPLVSGRKLIRIPAGFGFEVKRIRSSHHFLKHPDGRTTVVPVHNNMDVTRPLLRVILTQAGISVDTYLEAVKKKASLVLIR